MSKQVKQLVEKFLEEDPRTRDDDKLLTYKVFQAIAEANGEKIFIPFNLFNKFPAFETIKRTRAKIQNQEKRFLPEKESSVPEKSVQSREERKEIEIIPQTKWRNSQYQ